MKTPAAAPSGTFAGLRHAADVVRQAPPGAPYLATRGSRRKWYVGPASEARPPASERLSYGASL
jgi:hypothetical protein